MTTIIYRYEVDGVIRYVGSSFDYGYKKRKAWHVSKIEKVRGIESDRVEFFVIEECEDTIRFDREWHYIDLYRSTGHDLWNIADPRKQFPKNVIRGGHISEEQKRSISKNLKGRIRPDISAILTGKKRPDVTARLKGKTGGTNSLKGRIRPDISARQKGITRLGHPHSAETRRKMSETHKGKPSPNKGKPSPRKGKSNANKGQKRPAISAALTGKKRPDVTARLKGKPSPLIGRRRESPSEETRKKQSDAKIGKKRGPSPLKGRKQPTMLVTFSLMREIQTEYRDRGETCSWKQAGEILKERKKQIKI